MKTLPSLMLRHCIAGARTVTDAAGNSKLSKATEGGRARNHRDDVLAAAILCVAAGFRLKLEARRARRVAIL